MRLRYRISVGVSEDVADVVKAIADEMSQSESAVARYLMLVGLSSIGRMPQRAAGARDPASPFRSEAVA